MDRIVQQDARGRVSLGRENANKLFLARQEDDGTIVLEPVSRIVREKDLR